MPKPLPTNIISSVRAAKMSGCSQKEIAARHGITESAVSRIINGSRHAQVPIGGQDEPELPAKDIPADR
jgi:hypothetical protein